MLPLWLTVSGNLSHTDWWTMLVIDQTRALVAESRDLLNRISAYDAEQVTESKRLISASYKLLAKLNNPVWTAFIEK
jgi:hypothetical protein